MAMSPKTRAYCETSIANRVNFHNNTRLTGIDIHCQPRDYVNDYSFSGRVVIHDPQTDDVLYKVFSYDRCIGYYDYQDSTWHIDINARGISQTTNHHLSVLMSAIADHYDNKFIMAELTR